MKNITNKDSSDQEKYQSENLFNMELKKGSHLSSYHFGKGIVRIWLLFFFIVKKFEFEFVTAKENEE